jgi:hypothetical protein
MFIGNDARRLAKPECISAESPRALGVALAVSAAARYQRDIQ